MTEQKYTLILLLFGCFVVYTTACNSVLINQCFDSSRFGWDYGHPVLLNVPELDREAFCRKMENYTACLDELPRSDCSWEELEGYSSFERMGKFICANVARYDTYYDVISNHVHRDAWEDCFIPFDVEDTDSQEEACSELSNLVQCHMDEITDESSDAQTYVREFGDASLEDYYDFFQCAGSPTVGVTSSLMITSLLAYLWSTFH